MLIHKIPLPPTEEQQNVINQCFRHFNLFRALGLNADNQSVVMYCTKRRLPLYVYDSLCDQFGL